MLLSFPVRLQPQTGYDTAGKQSSVHLCPAKQCFRRSTLRVLWGHFERKRETERDTLISMARKEMYHVSY